MPCARAAATPSSSTTPSRTTTSPRSAWPCSTCFAQPACAPRSAGTTAAGARKSPKGCSGKRGSSPNGMRTRCSRTPRRGGRSCSASRAAFPPFARTPRHCFAARRGRRPRRSRQRACCSRNSARRPSGTCRSSPGPPKFCCTAIVIRSRWACWRRQSRCSRRIPGSTVVDLDAGCCGMAGSFGYAAAHFDVSRAIGERKLLPAVRNRKPGTVVVAAGTSCRHQVKDFTGERAIHPAVLLRSLLDISLRGADFKGNE